MSDAFTWAKDSAYKPLRTEHFSESHRFLAAAGASPEPSAGDDAAVAASDQDAAAVEPGARRLRQRGDRTEPAARNAARATARMARHPSETGGSEANRSEANGVVASRAPTRCPDPHRFSRRRRTVGCLRRRAMATARPISAAIPSPGAPVTARSMSTICRASTRPRRGPRTLREHMLEQIGGRSASSRRPGDRRLSARPARRGRLSAQRTRRRRSAARLAARSGIKPVLARLQELDPPAYSPATCRNASHCSSATQRLESGDAKTLLDNLPLLAARNIPGAVAPCAKLMPKTSPR